MTRLLRWTLVALLSSTALMVGVALFERVVPRRVRRAYQKHIGMPMFRRSAGVVPGWAVIETIGRKTGLPRQVPVGGRLQGDAYWIVAGDGTCDYVRNLEADPRVRLKLRGRWREGKAYACPDDDPRHRLLRLNPANSLFIWLAGTDLLTIRVDLT